MSLARLTSLSTQTLSLLLERQRLQSFSPSAENAPSQAPLHGPQIARNLRQLREGILALESAEGRSEALQLLRNQYGRMRAMLTDSEAAELPILHDLVPEQPEGHASATASTTSLAPSSRAMTPLPPKARERLGIDEGTAPFTPYSDDPERGPEMEPGAMLHMQRQIMDEQDDRLDVLSRSVNRQRDISLQINGELDTHRGLLESLDHEVDQTRDRLSGARRKLDRFARGMKGNGSTVTIALLILILLILIVVFKT